MKVTLFTTEDCGLCREAEQLLRRLQKKIQFELEIVWIAADPVLFSRYWDRVPVVAVEGRELEAASLDESRLRGGALPIALRDIVDR